MTFRELIRSGQLDPSAYRVAVAMVYHLERAAEGSPDGPEYWVQYDPDWIHTQGEAAC